MYVYIFQRPVYKSNSTNQRWLRLKNSVSYNKQEDYLLPQLIFEHLIEITNDKLYFAFTYPYTYSMVQEDMGVIDKLSLNIDYNDKGSIYCHRELIIKSIDGLNIDLITISDVDGINKSLTREQTFRGLFPNNKENGNIDLLTNNILKIDLNAVDCNDDKKKLSRNLNLKENIYEKINENLIKNVNENIFENTNENLIKSGNENINISIAENSLRPYVFDDKEIVFISARVHPGEVFACIYMFSFTFIYICIYGYCIYFFKSISRRSVHI